MSSSLLPPSRDALELRRRAQALRLLGQHLGATRATDLALRAGPEVWAGPAAQQCLDELRQMANRLRSTRDDLLAGARQLELLADLADAARRVTPLAPVG